MKNYEGTRLREYVSKFKGLIRNDSRVSYAKGEEFLKAEDYLQALTNLSKVIESDVNYEKAQSLIAEYLDVYKTTTITEAEQYVKENQYTEAITLLNDLIVILPDDANLVAKKELYTNQRDAYEAEQTKRMIEELKNNQEVVVESSKVIRTGSYIDFYYTEVVIKNLTDKVVKDYVVAWLGYDAEGYPIHLDYDGHLGKGRADAANIQPNKTYGKNKGWDLYYDSASKDVKTLLACVISVTYYDDTTWENPYYEHWLSQHLDKPLS